MSEQIQQVLLKAKGIEVVYRRGRQTTRAVRGVSLELGIGESVGLVGESGCGKTSLAKALMLLVPTQAGDLWLGSQPIDPQDHRAVRRYRRSVQMVFQDPHGSLNPRLTSGAAVAEVLTVVRGMPRRQALQEAVSLLEQVGIDSALAGRYPHELSGGQRQRVGLARALAVGPQALLADEPVSALDVSIQAQILNLIRRFQMERELSLLFISHDLAVVGYMCQRVMVMYAGEIVEEGPVDRVYEQPAHPYTRLLLEAVPDLDRPLVRGIHDRETELLHPPQEGCLFYPRCPFREEQCRREHPEPVPLAGGRSSRCFLAEELAGLGRDETPLTWKEPVE